MVEKKFFVLLGLLILLMVFYISVRGAPGGEELTLPGSSNALLVGSSAADGKQVEAQLVEEGTPQTIVHNEESGSGSGGSGTQLQESPPADTPRVPIKLGDAKVTSGTVGVINIESQK